MNPSNLRDYSKIIQIQRRQAEVAKRYAFDFNTRRKLTPIASGALDLNIEEAPLSPKGFPVTITPKVRAAVFQAWKNKCAYCQINPAEELDHIYPKSKGGKDDLCNFAASCKKCNRMKYNDILHEPHIGIVMGTAVRKAPKISKAINQRKRNAKNSAFEKELDIDKIIEDRFFICDISLSTDKGVSLQDSKRILKKRGFIQNVCPFGWVCIAVTIYGKRGSVKKKYIYTTKKVFKRKDSDLSVENQVFAYLLRLNIVDLASVVKFEFHF